MLEDLLRQRGISSRLEGAGLQGAVGELPAIGLVRLVVDENDFAAARAVIDEWEKTSVPEPTPPSPQRPIGALLGAVIGLVIGIGGTVLYFRTPVNTGGIDHNGDGTLDERWRLSPAGRVVRTEIDRNFDGAVDLVWNFDGNGVTESGESDDDFNGTFESQFRLRNGQVYISRTDVDGDGIADLKSLFTHGVLTAEEHRVGNSNDPVRVEQFRLGKLVSAEVDTDRDGILDRRYEYDAFGEVASVTEIGSTE